MSKIFLLLATMVGCTMQAQIFQTDLSGKVIELSDHNYDDQIAMYENILVSFTADWCKECRDLHPQFIDAAVQLSDSDANIFLARVDITLNPQLVSRFKFTRYPTQFWYKNGEKRTYDGPLNKEGIVKWVTAKALLPSVKVDCDNLKKEAKNHKFVLAYFGDIKDPLYTEVHAPLEDSGDKIRFFHVIGDDACAKEHKVDVEGGKSGVAFLRTFDEPVVPYTGAANLTELIDWMMPLMVPTYVFDFDKEHVEFIDEQKKPVLILFRNSSYDSDAAFMNVFTEASKALKGKILFSYSDIQDGLQQHIANMLDVTEEKMPVLKALSAGKKHKCPTKPADLTVEIISKWVDDILAGAAPIDYKSEPIPASNDAPVTIIVGDNQVKTITDPTKDVFVMFYSSVRCPKCDKIAPIYEKLGEFFAKNKDIVIAKLDFSANESQMELQIDGIPTFIYFPQENKKGIVYENDQELEEFAKFLTDPQVVKTEGKVKIEGEKTVKEDL